MATISPTISAPRSIGGVAPGVYKPALMLTSVAFTPAYILRIVTSKPVGGLSSASTILAASRKLLLKWSAMSLRYVLGSMKTVSSRQHEAADLISRCAVGDNTLGLTYVRIEARRVYEPSLVDHFVINRHRSGIGCSFRA